jgi:hypothetical protein
MSAFLYDGLLNMKFAHLYVFFPVWCLPNCMFAQQRDVAPPVCLFNYMRSASLWDVCLTVWCRHNCIISSYPCAVCSTVSCLPTCMMFAQLYYVCPPVWCLLYWMTSAYLCTCRLPVWSANLYDYRLTVWCLLIFSMTATLRSRQKCRNKCLEKL